MNFWQALDLPCDLFLLCRKNWYIEQLSQTEQGRQYLEDCERYKQTKPDLSALKKLMGELGG